MEMGKAATKAKNKYNNNSYDRINLVVPKGQKDEIKAFVEECGYSSVNSFIVDAIEHYTKAVQEEQARLAKLDETIMENRKDDIE